MRGVKHFKYWVPKEGDVFVDVGASTGQTVCELRQSTKEKIRIIAIEANPKACKILRERESDITIIQKGAWFEKGKAWFSSPNLDTVHGQVTVNETEAKLPERELVSIDVDTLDNILQELGIDSVNFVKIDVEGNEPAVIRGFRTAKAGTKFHIEWHMNLDQVLEELKKTNIEIVELIKWEDQTYKGQYGEIYAEKKHFRIRTAVIGIGNVGLPLAAVASEFHDVIGIDINEKWIESLRSEVHLEEPGLNESLKEKKLALSTDFADVKDRELIFIVVGSQAKAYAPDLILKVIEQITPHLNPSQIIAIISTLKPGSMEKEILPIASKLGIRGVCYVPVFVALGKAMKYFRNPGYLAIGSDNEEVSLRVKEFFSAMNEKTRFHFDSFSSVEVVKFAINLALINKISLLNVLMEYCSAYGGKIDFVTSIMKEDPRLAGMKMFKGGMGFGGTCFPLDARAFKESLESMNLDTSFVDSIMKVNEHQIGYSVNMMKYMTGERVSILGITYKEDTSVIIESQALEIAKGLHPFKEICVYDPSGMENAKKVLPVKYALSLKEAIEFGDILFFAVEWPEFLTLKEEDFKGKTVVDPWRMFKGMKIERYIGYGQ